ncbi:cache domain-containing sensor histidine kinase [Paenibacillus sp. 1P07SE]|uniref:cache domain-containing sensor histidine kinase n=1 Tax=Paenibacillus sp. 1P07SE TaxID=3132209 RepID=UPI0039A6BAFE
MKLKFSSLTFKLFMICFTFVLCCTTLLTQLAYVAVKNEISKNNTLYVQEILAKTDEYLELSFTSLQTILFSVQSAYDGGLREPEALHPQMRRLYELNYNYIHNLYIIHPDYSISGTSLLSRVFNESLAEREPLVGLAREDALSISVSPTYRSTYAGWTVTLLKALDSGREAPVAALDMDMRRIEQRLLQINRESDISIAIIDASGRLVAGVPGLFGTYDEASHTLAFQGVSSQEIAAANNGTIKAATPEGRPLTINKHASARFGWSVISMHDEGMLARSLATMQRYYVFFLAGGMAISLLAAYAVTRFIRAPLQRIMLKMNQIRLGNLDVTIGMDRKDEFGVLSTTFDAMILRIRELLTELHQKEETKRQIEIQMLQAQINPHFLYNTLGSISNAVSLGKLDKVDPIIQSLIRIMEYGMSDVNHLVTLREELDNARDYLNIQNVRYNRLFPLETSIPETLMTSPVLRMILQPIVENCIFHGYKGGRIEGVIRISAVIDRQALCLTVEDEGEGMSQAKLESILNGRSAPGRARARIGMFNIHQRIRLRYGSSYGLQIESVKGEGTRVSIILPAYAEDNGGEKYEQLPLPDRG